MKDAALIRLQKAVEGLVFVSEADAPFEAFGWEREGKLTPAAIRELGGHKADENVTEIPFDTFFGPLTKDEDWFGDEEKAVAARYRELVKACREELTEPKVFKVGKTNVSYYVLGRSKAGNLVGVKTQGVET
jgi:hypothetical protein